MVGCRWRLVAVRSDLLTTSCAGFVLRQDVESARTNWEINPSSQRAMIYAAALHDAFDGPGLRGPDGGVQAARGRSAGGPRRRREPWRTAACDADRRPRSLASGSRAQSRRLGGASAFDGRRADAGGGARHRVGLGGAEAQRRGGRSLRTHAAGDARARQPFPVARSLREEHARHDRSGGAGLGAAGGARVLSRRARATGACLPNRQLRWPPWIKPAGRASGADSQRSSQQAAQIANDAAMAAAQQAAQMAATPP